jgi:hypothetical protein
MQRRSLLQAIGTLLGSAATFAPAIALNAPKTAIQVWKTPTCGCCHDWIKHLETNGFEAKIHDVSDAAKRTMRIQQGLADKYGSCHTAMVEGYVIEGHVPASDIRRLLKDRPRALGLAVPGMPVGSPGMDGPEYKGQRDAFAVLLVQRDGNASVYKSYS